MKFIYILMIGAIAACSSNSKKELVEVDNSETIKKDYIVRDASSNIRPSWIYQTQDWASEFGKNSKDNRYFAFETEPKVNREIACNLAKANVKSDIAGEITTFISKTLGASEQGSANIDENNPEIEGLRSYVENTLTSKIQAIITGSAVEQTYWEKRNYKQDLGAKKDYIGYTCAALVRIPKARINKAIDQAEKLLNQKTDDPEAKQTVKSAIAEAKEEFAKITQ